MAVSVSNELRPTPSPPGSVSSAPAYEGTLPAGRLQRLLGKASSAWTAQDLVALYRDQRLRLLSLMHVGGDGWLKTLDFVPRSDEHLYDVLVGGERADGSSLFAGMGIRPGRSDILLRPRIASAFLDPFAEQPSLVVLCSHAGRDQRPLPESPDTILRRACAMLQDELDLQMLALGEVEYFLGKRSAERDIYGASDRGYHASSPFVFGESLRREAMCILAEIGVPVKYGHSEVGYIQAAETEGVLWEQHEIELALAPLPAAAEAVVLTQWVLRNLAHRQNMLCSFDPIMRRGHAGSGLHFHFSPTRQGQHLGCRDADGQLHEPARWLIGGLVQLGGALMAFGNRVPGSLVRLNQAKEAPSGIAWGESDRSALVRLPILATNEQGEPMTAPTIEFRLPDGSAHPHLLLAGVAQSTLQGRETADLEGLIEATASARSGGPDRSRVTALPVSMLEIAEDLQRQRGCFERHGVFPPHVIDAVASELSPGDADS